MLLSRRGVKTKLGLGFGVILVLVFVLGLLSLFMLKRTGAVTDHIYAQTMAGQNVISDIEGMLSGMRGHTLNELLLRRPARSTLKEDVAATNKKIMQRWAMYYPELVSSAQEKAAADKVIAQYKALVPEQTALVEKYKKFDYLGATSFYVDTVRKTYTALFQQIDALTTIQSKEAQEAYAQGLQVQKFSRTAIIVVLAVAVVLTLLITILLTRMITRPLARADGLVDAIADGRLNSDTEHRFKDEFGIMLSKLGAMQQRLAETVAEVRHNAESVNTGANEIAKGNDELSSRTQQQAANLQQTAASMEQMTSTVKQNADNAAQADQLASGVRDQAQEGSKIINGAVSAMQEINKASDRIGEIIGMIDEIAFQTNLLALNASVEAARAGEHGRGFSVVAAEVRKLAGRSAEAASEIKELVTDSADKVKHGSEQVSLSGETLNEIANEVKRVSEIVAEISAANTEQSSGIDQVNLAVSQMDSTTQQNASLVEQSAAASRSLEEQAIALKQQVAFFHLADDEPQALPENETTDALPAPQES